MEKKKARILLYYGFIISCSIIAVEKTGIFNKIKPYTNEQLKFVINNMEHLICYLSALVFILSVLIGGIIMMKARTPEAMSKGLKVAITGAVISLISMILLMIIRYIFGN